MASPQFEGVIESSHKAAGFLSAVAPVVALADPALGAGLLATAAVAQAVYVAGTAAQMANGVKPWSVATLAEGGVELAADAVGAGAASGSGGLLREVMSDGRIPPTQVESLVKAFPDISVQSALKVTTALDVVHAGFGGVQDFQSFRHDVVSGDYASAATDAAKLGLDAASVVTDAPATQIAGLFTESAADGVDAANSQSGGN